MIRYRCPHCAALTVAHERRVGQSSVCKACLKPHQIPTDSALWLTDAGAPLNPPTEPPAPPAPVTEPIPVPHVTAAEVPTESERHEPAPIDSRSAGSDIELYGPLVVEPAQGREVEPEPVPVRAFEARVPEPVLPEMPEPIAVRAHESRPAQGGESAADEPEPASIATTTPPPQLARQAVPIAPRAGRFVAPVPHARAGGAAPTYAEPVQLQTQADIAAALTVALTSRMKPPAEPRRDLRPSTAVWMLLTGLGVVFILVSLFGDLDYRWVGGGIGALQVVLGYLWIVRLTHLRDPKRGLLCALPPLTLFYISQHKYAKFRPLRFLLTGAALMGLAVVAPQLATLTRPLVPRTEPKPPPPDIASLSKLAQVRAYRERREYGSLVKLLEVLVKTDPIRSVDARDRAELAAELEALCAHEDRAVRLEAMSAFVSWDLDPNAGHARAVCLEAVRSPSEDERVRALRLLPRWKDAESARAVQSLIGRAGRQSNQAKASLEEIGGAPAEQAALALLKRADDQATRLTAIGILEKVGGATAADELGRYAMATDDPPVRTCALAAVNVIRTRIRTPAP